MGDGTGCERCTPKARRRAQDERRGSPAERGYDADWRALSRSIAAAHPLCVYCRETCLHCGRPRQEHAGAPAGDERAAVARVVTVLAGPRVRGACVAFFGRVTPTWGVDHIETIEARPELRLERANLAACCQECNTRKANALEGGGWTR